MSLPPGFLDELKTRVSLAEVVGRKVIWDTRKSNQNKGDMWAPCPFHQEKTASFHVDDRKGFYYCFGCHAKGDLISFVQETDNLTFFESVGMLARIAGMPIPDRDPKAQEAVDRRIRLSEVMEQAVQHYRLQLKTAGASTAREYLAGRGFEPALLDRWEIGFAPVQRQGLFRHLRDKGVSEDLIVDAGLAAKPDDGGAPFDRFRGRIIFPIRDERGRAIGLGGRAMDPNARAKYLNSPETALFDKGRSLYNHAPAREAAGPDQPLIVVEGYMDVIALAEAGFKATVAPLGTAITEDQLRLLWRIHEEPVIALDGDTAGLRAAMRVIDHALPILEAGKSLRFCILPEGLDPDDLIRREGAGAMRRLLDHALPMVQILWRRETEGRVFDSPERKAALDRTLREAIRTVRDPSIRRHYGDEINRLRRGLFNGSPASSGPRRVGLRGRFVPVQTAPAAETRSSALAAAGAPFQEQLREAVILATLVRHPGLVAGFVPGLERLECSRPEHEAVRLALLETEGAPEGEIGKICGAEALAAVFQPPHVRIAPSLHADADRDVATMAVAEELAKLSARRGARREIDEAIKDAEGLIDEGLTWRLGQAAEAVGRAERSGNEDRTEYDTADNGVRLSRAERKKAEALYHGIDFSKGGRRA